MNATYTDLPPQKSAAAPKDGHTQSNQTFSHNAENVNRFLGGKFHFDDDNASVIKLAKKLVCYEGLIAKASERTQGETVATAMKRHGGQVFAFVYCRGFKQREQNGWVRISTADGPLARCAVFAAMRSREAVRPPRLYRKPRKLTAKRRQKRHGAAPKHTPVRPPVRNLFRRSPDAVRVSPVVFL